MSEIKLSQHKRLIVCCDGTWQDSTADSTQPPSNVTRISRALSRSAIVEEQDGVKRLVPQIVYYQKGVGTGLGDRVLGGAAGLGLSANIRSAYGFLADNYTPGDTISFFGFSRGAYTARAIAGLICNLGLLTSRGMDNFSVVYDDYYNNNNNKIPRYTPAQRHRLGFRPALPKFTIQIVGVWDTVGFHQAWLGNGVLPWGWGRGSERLEFRNTLLSEDVRWAFQALSLDEERDAYKPVLWHVSDSSGGHGHGDGDGERERQELRQVWFSGVHTDVGGGAEDARLANIALGWMIAQCAATGQLAFDIEGYLFDEDVGEGGDTIPWATSRGQNQRRWSFMRFVTGLVVGRSRRTPLRYPPPQGGDQGFVTNEALHESIKDRGCGREMKGVVEWPCAPLKRRRDAKTWELVGGGEMVQVEASDREKYMKGRIRTVHVDRVD